MTDAETQAIIDEVCRDIRVAFAIAFWPPDVVDVFEREGLLHRYEGGGASISVPMTAVEMAENAGFRIWPRMPGDLIRLPFPPRLPREFPL